MNDFYPLVNNRDVNINTAIFSINSKSEGRQQRQGLKGEG